MHGVSCAGAFLTRIRGQRLEMRSVEYKADRLHCIASLEESHFWFVPRRRRLLDLVASHLSPGRRVLDVGCGTGGFAAALRRRGHEVFGADPHARGRACP